MNPEAIRPFICLLILLPLGACQKEHALPEAAIQVVRAGTVDRIEPDTPVEYSAAIAAYAQTDLSFKAGGRVDHLLQVRGADGRMRDVQVGDRVEKGAELARVGTGDYEQRVHQAQTEQARMEVQLAQANAAVLLAETDYTRSKRLFESASLIKPEYDQARARFESAKLSVQAAEAGVATAHTLVDQATTAMNDTSVVAPLSGWIIARNVAIGSLAGNTMIAFSILDTHLVKAVFAIPDTLLKSVRLGNQQIIRLDAIQRPLRGTVTAISPQADPKSRVFSVEVTIDNPNEDVRPGMIGVLSFGPMHQATPRLVVPLEAVVRSPDAPGAFAVYRLSERNGKTYVTSQTILIGNTYGNSMEVTQGLEAGDRIVTLGGALLRNGQEVRLLP